MMELDEEAEQLEEKVIELEENDDIEEGEHVEEQNVGR